MRREERIDRTKERVRELIGGFGRFVDEFDKKFTESTIWTGPSRYFHWRSVERLRVAGSVEQAVNDDAFLETVYATLTAWGVHRMDGKRTKLTEFKDFKESVRSKQAALQTLEQFRIWDVPDSELDLLWLLISELKVGVAKTKLVAGSKAVHHFLPDLWPPVDRKHTITFFYPTHGKNGGSRVNAKTEKHVFAEISRHFREIACRCRPMIEERLGTHMNTSPTKVIDNAIVAFVKLRIAREW